MKKIFTEILEPKGGCLSEALRLLEEKGGGEVFWVGQVRVRGQPVDIHHAHFVPTGAEDSTLALNQNDNGFGEYPALTVGQLRRIGSVQKPEILVQYRQVSNKK